MDAFPDMSGAKGKVESWTDPTEDGVALAFAADKVGKYVHDHTACHWRVWRDGRWAQDTLNSVFNEAREFTRSTREAMNEQPRNMTKIAFCSAVERACRADPRLAVDHDVWDTDPWLLGVPGGVVNLRTGETLPATPDLYISRQTSVAPAPRGTKALLWCKFLKEATAADEEMIGFLQRLAGYVLTGEVNEEILAFLYGIGGNGKGVFIGVILSIMYEYAVTVPIEVFTANSKINLEYYRAKMAGARLVTASETEAQTVWAESQIKELTGNEAPLSARHPYGKPFEFRPKFKLLIVGNNAPKLKGRSKSMERRLRILPFNNEPEKPNENLKATLQDEYPAILRWMIDGCLMWQKEGIGSAKVIRAATEVYFENQDSFKRWLEDRCTMEKDRSQTSGVLLKDYNTWAKASGEDPLTTNGFAEIVDRTPGLKRVKTRVGRFVEGVMLKASDTANDDNRYGDAM